MKTVPLHTLAHGRTGDKGNRANISVIAWAPELYPLLVEQIGEAVMAQAFAHRRPSRVQRFVLPTRQAMNFVLDGVLLNWGNMAAFSAPPAAAALGSAAVPEPGTLLLCMSAWLPFLIRRMSAYPRRVRSAQE